VLRRLRSVQRRTCAPGYASSTGVRGAAGHTRFFGGTFVATCTVSERPRTTSPTSRSEWCGPYASAVSMKFSPRSIARSSARTDSSSSAPIHCDPPIPQAP
jgi:hypothetical protein